MIIALTACTQVHVYSSLATPNDCQELYNQIIDIAITDMGYGNLLSDEKIDAANQIDQIWRSEGKTDRFMQSCQTSMTEEQYVCARRQHNLDQMSDCIHFYYSKGSRQ